MDGFGNTGNTTEHNNVENSLSDVLAYYVIICFVSIIAFVEHCATVMVVCVSKKLKEKPFVVSILLLSCSDIVYTLALLLISVTGMTSLNQTWMCALTFFLTHLGMVSSLSHTLIICIERYLHTRPRPMHVFSTRKRQLIACINMGICSLILGIPYLFIVKTLTIERCALNFLFEENMPYASAPIMSSIFLIWLSTIVMYVLTAKNVRNAIRRTNRLKPRKVKNPGDKNAMKCSANQTSPQTTPLSIVSNKIYQLVPEYKCQRDEGNASNTSRHQSIVKPETSKYPDETNQDTTEIIPIETVPVRQSRASNFTDEAKASSVCKKSLKIENQMKSISHSQSAAAEAFRIVSVVLVVFLLSMTAQSMVGIFMLFFPVPKSITFGCGLLAITTVITNPFMYAFLRRDFRNSIRCR